MSNSNIKFFSDLSKNDVLIAGGKGASLGEMISNKFPIPNGFVILSTAFDNFIEENGLTADIDSILSKVNHNDVNSVENASKQIQGIIKSVDLSKELEDEIKKDFKKLDCLYVAVRSSATSEDSADAAWAGQLDSYLNTTKENLIEKVRSCWASLFTPRAISYRFEKNLHDSHISVAVVVQKMVQSDVSGIAFSVHPVTEDYNQLIIEAGYGLGEAIVSGSITPDSYVVLKDSMKIEDCYVAEQERKLIRTKNKAVEWVDVDLNEREKQKLSNDQINKLSKIIIDIENHYSFPCDIEWAIEKGVTYITQSRPITTLKPRNKESRGDG